MIRTKTARKRTRLPALGFAAGDPNLCRYVGNDPTNAVDPTGTQEVKVTGGNVKSFKPGESKSLAGKELFKLRVGDNVYDVGVYVREIPSFTTTFGDEEKEGKNGVNIVFGTAQANKLVDLAKVSFLQFVSIKELKDGKAVPGFTAVDGGAGPVFFERSGEKAEDVKWFVDSALPGKPYYNENLAPSCSYTGITKDNVPSKYFAMIDAPGPTEEARKSGDYASRHSDIHVQDVRNVQ